MTHEEILLRQRHNQVYRPLVDTFFTEIGKLNFVNQELAAIPSLFLPACGKRYPSSLVKIAVIGQETLRWGWDKDGLAADFRNWKEGRFDGQLSFSAFQDEGPVEWQNRFWQYHFSVLEKIYGRSGLLEGHNAILDGIAWSNRFAVERNGANVGNASEQIPAEHFWQIRGFAEKSGLSTFEAFRKVFNPDVILYSCRNEAMGSDSVLAPFAKQIDKRECDGFKIWTWKMGKTWIFQTWHPSYLSQYKGVSIDEFADAIREEMIKRKVFAPIGATRHYADESDGQVRTFAERLSEEADRLVNASPDIGDQELSYRLLGALALELQKQRATMTARRAVLLLNETTRFREHNYLFAPGGHGPCQVVAAAYRRFDARGTEEDRLVADAIAGAFTTVRGTYAYEE